MRYRTCRKLGLLAGVLAVAGIAPAASAALIDLQVMSATDTVGSISGDKKSVTVTEGGTVTVGIYISGVPSQGLGAFGASVRTFNEMYGATAFTNPTPTDTVMNVTSSALNPSLDSKFNLAPTAGVLIDLGTSDPSDTDIDLKGIGASMTPGSASSVTTGLAMATPYLIGTATLTALDLDEALRPGDRTVHINSVLSGDGAAVIKNITATFGLTTVSPNTLGSDAVVTVQAGVLVPEPATLGFLALAGLLGLRRQRRA